MNSHSNLTLMNLRQNTNGLERGDVLALIFSGLIGMMISYILVSDRYFFSRTYIPMAKSPVAEIIALNKGVKHRTAEVPLWQKSASHQTLGNNDQVFTNSESRAEIQFKESGTVLELEPNSLVVVREADRRIEDDWFRWENDRNAPPSPKAIIEVNGRTAVLASGSRVQLGSTPDGTSAIKVLAGKVTIATANGPTVAIQANEAAMIKSKPDAPPVVEPLTLNLISPVYSAVITTVKSLPEVRLAWSASQASPDGYQVEVSLVGGTAAAQTSVFTTDEPFLDFYPPTTGTYSWRVSQNGNPASGIQGKFTIVAQKAPILLYPSHEFTMTYRSSEQGTLIFRWEATEGIKSRFQFATSANFDSPNIDIEINNESHAASPSGTGDFYWRVGQDYGSKTLWSDTRRLTVRPPLQLKPPIASPAVVQANNAVRFSWRDSQTSVSGYQVLIAKNREFTDPYRILASSAATTWKAPETGIYYWQVQGFTLDNQFSPPSDRKRFEITSALDVSHDTSIQSQQQQLSEDAASISTPDTNTAIREQKVMPPLERAIVDEAQSPTAPKVAALEPISKLTTSITSPALVQYADPDNTGLQIKLSWKAVDEAKNYLVQLSPSRQFTDITKQWRTSKPLTEISSLEQTSYWRVRPDVENYTWSEIGKIEKVPHSPISISSVASDNNATHIQLKWALTEPLEGIITIRHIDSGNETVSQTTTQAAGSITLKDLPPGNYSWHYQTQGEDKRIASRVDYFTIAVPSPPSSSNPIAWQLQFAPYATAFDYSSRRGEAPEYSSTDFSAGLDSLFAITKAHWKGFGQYRMDYAEFFLVEEDQEPEPVLNKTIALGGGYQFSLTDWMFEGRLSFRSQDFVSVLNRDNVLSTENDTAEWLAGGLATAFTWKSLELGLDLTQSLVHLNSNDFLAQADMTEFSSHIRQPLGDEEKLSVLYQLGVHRFRAEFGRSEGYVTSNATVASIGLRYLF